MSGFDKMNKKLLASQVEDALMDDILIKEMTRIPVMLPLSAKMSVRPYLIIKKRWVSRSTLPVLILR